MKEYTTYSTAGTQAWYILEVNMEKKMLDRHKNIELF